MRLSLLAAMILLNIFTGPSAAAQTGKTITLGMVSEINQQEIEQHFQPFIDYVAKKLSFTAKLNGRVVVASSPSRLANLLTGRRVEFYMESPYPTYLINSVYGGGKLLLRRWKGGMGDYHALIFTKRDSETKSLDDLRGKVIAFEDPESTSGHFLPKLFLTRKGFKLTQKTGVDASVLPGQVGYIFASSESKMIDLVLTKKVAAGAFSNDDYARLEAGKKSDIAILGETASLPRHLVSVRKDLPSALARGLEKTLLSMHQDPEGRVILQKADGTTKFDALPGGELAMRQRLLDIHYSPQKK